jgi:hypothetical protein
MAFLDDLKAGMKRQAAPVTVGICTVIVLMAVLSVFTKPSTLAPFMFEPDWLSKPWSILTYPFVYLLSDAIAIIFLIFTVMWTLWVGGTIERDQGPVRYAIIWGVFTVLSAVCLLIGWNATHVAAPLYGPWLPLGALTVIWGFRNRTAPVMLFGVIPLTGYWLALLTVAMVFVDYAHPVIVLGIFACLPLLLAYAFAVDRIPRLQYAVPKPVYRPSKAQQLKEQNFFDDVRKREKEREERERLKKLFESSFDDER